MICPGCDRRIPDAQICAECGCRTDLGLVLSIRVYRDHELWATVDRWWQMGAALLADLHVATYQVYADQIDWRQALRRVHDAHPGCVYVHIDR